MARLYFHLTNPMLFRWGGEYTWMVTGPVSAGLSEPLPLPTTVLGAVLGTKRGAELDENEVLARLGERLGCRVEALRGPYYPLRGYEGLAVHAYPGGLILLDKTGAVKRVLEQRVLRAQSIRRTGLALTYDAKTAVRGLLYQVELLDPKSLEVNGVEPQVSVDVVGCGECKARGVVKLGGDMRVALLACDDRDMLLDALGRGEAEGYCVLASPLLLDITSGREAAERLLHGMEVEIDGCVLRAPRVNELERLVAAGEVERAKLAKRARVRVEVLHPGVYGDTGFPRQPHLAVLPGAILHCKCSREALLRGVGRYARLGFGTLVPLASRRGS